MHHNHRITQQTREGLKYSSFSLLLIVVSELLWCWFCFISPGVETVINLDSCPRLCCVESLNLREFGPGKFLKSPWIASLKRWEFNAKRAKSFILFCFVLSCSSQQLAVHLRLTHQHLTGCSVVICIHVFSWTNAQFGKDLTVTLKVVIQNKSTLFITQNKFKRSSSLFQNVVLSL